MITEVYARGLKGLSFGNELGQRTLVVGPNGSGKSSRSIALQLLALGHAPGTGAGKQNKAVIDAFCSGESELRVGVIIDGAMSLERRIFKTPSGPASQTYKVAGKTCKTDAFSQALVRADISIIDLSEFMGLSDAKKIDMLLGIFPPADDVNALEAHIDDVKKQKSDLERKARELETSASRLRTSRAQLELPAGTLAESRARIAELETSRDQAKTDLRQEEQDQREALEKAQVEAETRLQTSPQLSEPPTQPRSETRQAHVEPIEVKMLAILENIERTMDSAGCVACAAKLVIKKIKRGIAAMKEAA